jgi:putative mRNA 3-end processing factor
MRGVTFSFHPAGHIPGSAQIRVEHGGEVWVFSGDYKVEADGISEPFEPIRCHTFITESTFGLPVYQWPSQQEIFADINQWWQQNRAEGRVSVLAAYTLGKSQRLLKNIDTSMGPVYVHGAVDAMNRVVKEAGVNLPEALYLSANISKKALAGALVICPPSAIGSPWMARFPDYSLGVASGWMALRGTRRRRGADRGFVLSDHADWPGLNQVIGATGAQRVYVTHGYTDWFAAWLNEKGIEAYEVKTGYEGERVEGAAVEE